MPFCRFCRALAQFLIYFTEDLGNLNAGELASVIIIPIGVIVVLALLICIVIIKRQSKNRRYVPPRRCWPVEVGYRFY